MDNPDFEDTKTRKRPVSKGVFYSIAFLILVVGWGSAGMMGWKMVKGGSGLVLLAAPGSGIFHLAAGDYTLYHEYEGVADGKIYYQPLAPDGLKISLSNAGENPGAVREELKLSPLAPSAVYAFGTRHGAEIARFSVAKAGDYRLDAPAETVGNAPATMLAIGNGKERATVTKFQEVLGITLITTILSAALWLWTTLRPDMKPLAARKSIPA